MRKSKLTVGLLWHSFKSNNLGVLALTDANIGLIADAAPDRELEFVIFGSRGDSSFSGPGEYANVRHVDVSSVFSVKSIYDQIRKCDIVYDIGGGDSFADIYGWKRLAKVAGLKLVAAAAGRKPVLSSANHRTLHFSKYQGCRKGGPARMRRRFRKGRALLRTRTGSVGGGDISCRL